MLINCSQQVSHDKRFLNQKQTQFDNVINTPSIALITL